MLQPNTKRRIIKHQLVWILDDCFDDREIFTLAIECGLCHSSAQQHSVSKDWLVRHLADAFFEQALTEQAVNHYLVQKAQQAIRRVEFMKVEEVQTYLENPTYLLQEGVFGETVWALLIDSREAIQRHGEKLLKDHGRSPPTTHDVAPSEESAAQVQTPEAETPNPFEHQGADNSSSVVLMPDQPTEAPLQEVEPNPHAILGEMKQRFVEQEERFHQLEGALDELKHECVVAKNANNTLNARIEQLERENYILREQSHQYRTDRARLQQLEPQNQVLNQEVARLSNELEQLHDLKVEKAELSVALQSLEESVYRGERTLEQMESDFQAHIAALSASSETSKVALAHAQQKIVNLACQREAPGEEQDYLIAGQPCVGVFVDVQNMFYAAKDRYARRVDYIKLLDLTVGPRQLIVAYAYVVQIPEIKQSAFLSLLEHNGYTIKSKDLRLRGDGTAKGDWDVGIAIDIVSMLEALDVVILASGDGDFCPLAELIKRQGKRVEVVAFEHNTSMDLQRIADQFFPIGDDLLI